MLKILIVDDEQIIREGAASVVRKCLPGAEVTVCDGAKAALAEAAKIEFDIAFLDIEMPEINGITLAKKLKKEFPNLNVIFSTSYPQYALDAMNLHASGYVTKPLTAAKVHAELENLRHPVEDADHGLRVQAFGNFDAFHDGQPLHFKYSKTKEMLAYLIDRNGATVDIGEIRSNLWEDDEDRTSYMKQLRKDLLDTFAAIGEEDALVSVRGGLGIVPSKFRCDFFDYLAGKPSGINAYHGEYMQQYTWSELTHGSLEMREL